MANKIEYSMKKIALIGAGGTGKSTLAKELGEILKLPVYHLDTLYWKPGWVSTPTEEWEQVMVNLVSKDKLVDKGFSKSDAKEIMQLFNKNPEFGIQTMKKIHTSMYRQ